VHKNAQNTHGFAAAAKTQLVSQPVYTATAIAKIAALKQLASNFNF
jgi:hypothetical protein